MTLMDYEGSMQALIARLQHYVDMNGRGPINDDHGRRVGIVHDQCSAWPSTGGNCLKSMIARVSGAWGSRANDRDDFAAIRDRLSSILCFTADRCAGRPQATQPNVSSHRAYGRTVARSPRAAYSIRRSPRPFRSRTHI